MQSLRSLFNVHCVSQRSLFTPRLARHFSSTRVRFNTDNDKKAQDFPWLLSKDEPRIKDYPYEQASKDWSFINMLPRSIQHALCNWLGSRILQLNTGFDNFPDQFLVGASLATRQAIGLLSDQLNNPKDETKEEELHHIFTPELLNRFIKAKPSDVDINIGVPQIYDVNLGDIWVTLGNPAAFSDERKYEVLRWMTVQIGFNKAKGDELEESFQEYKQRVSKSIAEGIHISVDVLIDADITYRVNRKGQENDIILYDEGRRTLRMKFVTPYFTPASSMVSGRDPETSEPINDWNWRIGDIDQLIEKESIDAIMEEE